MKKIFKWAMAMQIVTASLIWSQTDKEKYAHRFIELYTDIKNPANGYFSPEGVPYHSSETFICEAPDYGHETSSEAYSYWLWLEGMFGFMSNQWTGVGQVWASAEKYIIPQQEDQPTNSFYNPASPAVYAPEFELASQYPAPLDVGVPSGQDPLGKELTTTYGTPNIYGMHWLLDVDNWYGYGRRGDGVTKPSYMNTFQRGTSESVWATVPHPSWDDFSKGGKTGFLPLFIKDKSYAKQWRYTDAPDADARMVQAMYWTYLWAKEKGQTPASVLPIDKASKLGDYLRYSLMDKYFHPIPCSGTPCNQSGDYANGHYLLSWYYAWGGAINAQEGWAFRIGASHNHFGYQNPVAAYALGFEADFKPKSPNASKDWATSFDRQLEFYQWLQSAEGGIGGCATSSWNGRYEAAPTNVSTFYGLKYTEAPVYSDPPSNGWFGWQAWSVERLGEIFFINGNPKAEAIMDRWIKWVLPNIKLNPDGTYAIPNGISWKGQPDTWKGLANFTGNPTYHVTIDNYTNDIGVTASLARTLIHYSAGKKKFRGGADTTCMRVAKELIDRMWTLYRDNKGLSAPEERSDYSRIFDQEVYVPSDFKGAMANGDSIKAGIKFIDIRSKYKQDPDFKKIETAYKNKQAPVMKYHRFWAQVEVALANAEYARFTQVNPNVPPIIVDSNIALGVKTTPAMQLPFKVTRSGLNLQIQSPNEGGVLEFVSLQGKTVLKKMITKSVIELSVKEIPQGVYLIRLNSKNKLYQQRLEVF